jgi:phosphomannomutase
VLRPNQARELTDLYHQGVYPRVGNHEMAEARTDTTTLARHHAAVTATIETDLIASRRFKVVIDCCNGAGSIATPRFLRMLGCEVHELHTDINGLFPHNPEPLPGNIVELCEAVRRTGADLGFAQDADADRLAIVDEKGEPLGEDATVALAIRHWLSKRPGPVVVNLSTSRMIDDIAADFGVPVFRSPVGEVNVVEAMIRHKADIGGEGNGGVIAAPVNPCRDSFVGMALILEALAREGGTISEMRSRIPRYAMIHEKLECAARDVAPSLRLLRRLWEGHPMDLTDGVKVHWPDRWVQARPSNTEQVIRLDAEAPTESEARDLVNEALECLSPSA